MDKQKETRWNLRIYYRDEAGRDVAPMRKKSCVEGLLCTVDSPVFPGMKADKKIVAVNLYDHQTVVVTYRYMRNWD